MNMKKIFIPLIVLLLVSACSSGKATIKQAPLFEAEAVFKQANDKIKEGYYEDARNLLERIKVQDTSGEYAPLAEIRIGDTYYKDKSYEEAAIEYEQFLEMYLYHKYAPYAQYKLAMSYFKRIGTPDVSYSVVQQALKEFKKLLRLYPRNPYLNIVESRIKKCKSILAEYEFYVGEFYFKKGSYGAAARRFNDLLENFSDSKKEPDALFYLGLSYKNLGEKDKAQKALTTLIEKFPTIELSKEAREIIASLRSEK